MLGQLVGVADRARQHSVFRLGIGTNDTHHLQLHCVTVECLDHTDVGAHILIYTIPIGIHIEVVGEDGLKGQLTDLLVAPTVFPALGKSGARGCRLDNSINVRLAEETQGIKGQVIQLVFLVEHQDDLVLLVRPNTVDQLVLLL